MADANSTPMLPLKEAKKAGLLVFSGNTCPKCGETARHVSNGQCLKCVRERQREPERIAYKRLWAEKNAERIKAQRQAKYQRTREQVIARSKQWVEKNKDKRLAISKSYKARRRQQEAGGDTTAEIREWENSQKKVCYWCGSECASSYHLDHYEPLAKGGKHEISNLVIACAGCNLKKNAKDPYKFAGMFGRLF